MYIIKGQDCAKCKIVQALLTLKGVDFAEELSDIFSLETKTNKLIHIENIIRYIDDRFPVPQLITGEIPHRAILIELVHHIGNNPLIVEKLIANADPFINGTHISILDILAYVYTQNKYYKAFMHEVIYDD
jgi:glutaredoxin